MMKRVGILLILFFFGPTWANEVVAPGGISMKASPALSKSGERRLEICTIDSNKSRCSQYPKGVNFLFSGKPAEWNDFYKYCVNSEHLNTLATTSQLIQAMLLLPALGFAAALAVETGVDSLSPKPYPNVGGEAAFRSIQLLAYVLQDKRKRKTIKNSRYLVGVEAVLDECSKGYRNHIIAQKSQKCLSGCHGTESLEKIKPGIPIAEVYRRLEEYSDDGSRAVSY